MCLKHDVFFSLLILKSKLYVIWTSYLSFLNYRRIIFYLKFPLINVIHILVVNNQLKISTNTRSEILFYFWRIEKCLNVCLSKIARAAKKIVNCHFNSSRTLRVHRRDVMKNNILWKYRDNRVLIDFIGEKNINYLGGVNI